MVERDRPGSMEEQQPKQRQIQQCDPANFAARRKHARWDQDDEKHGHDACKQTEREQGGKHQKCPPRETCRHAGHLRQPRHR